MTDTRPRIRYWIPEAYANEDGLRADVRSFARRGFGGVEVVSCNFFGMEVPESCHWGSERFYEALRVICEEARACGLVVDVANGPQWPIAAPQIISADDPAALYEFTFGCHELDADEATAPLPLPERRVTHDEGTPKLEAACAYRLVAPGVLDEASYVDLMPFVQGDAGSAATVIDWHPAGVGTWAVFAFWGQPACHKIWDRFYVIDHLSRAGAEASVAWWRDTLMPALGDAGEVVESFFCDSLEWKASMDWTRGFADAFQERYGYDLRRYLPVVGEARTYPKSDVPPYRFDDADLSRAVNRDYRALLSHLYQEEHLRVLTEGAARLGKTVRYQVAYNKALSEEDAAGCVSIPETESFNRPSLDNLRTMAGSAHLTRRERLSFEGAAEGGNGYGQTQGDLMWWLKRAAIAGVSAQVLHGAGYCGAYGDGWVPGLEHTGFEAFGTFVSNYWNRTLSERSMAEMCAAIARMNELRRLQPQVDLAFVREAYLNNGHGGDGSFLVRDGGLLEGRGYSYEFLSPTLLEHENAQVAGSVLDPEGACYRALVLAGQEGVTAACLRRLAELAAEGLPVFVVGQEQLRPYAMADLADYSAWQEAYGNLLDCANVHMLTGYSELLDALDDAGILPAAAFAEPMTQVFTAHVRDGAEDIYLLYNGNRVAFDANEKLVPETAMPGALATAFAAVNVAVELRGVGLPYLFDLRTGARYTIAHEAIDGGARVMLPMEPDQLVAIGFGPGDEVGTLSAWSYDGLEEVALVACDAQAFELAPSGNPLDFLAGGFHAVENPGERFAGFWEYCFSVELSQVPSEAYLRLPAWNDALTLEVNDERVPVVAGLGHVVDVRKQMRDGANTLIVRVYTNLRNRLCEKPDQRYGLFGRPVLLVSMPGVRG